MAPGNCLPFLVSFQHGTAPIAPEVLVQRAFWGAKARLQEEKHGMACGAQWRADAWLMLLHWLRHEPWLRLHALLAAAPWPTSSMWYRLDREPCRALHAALLAGPMSVWQARPAAPAACTKGAMERGKKGG